MLIAGLRDGKDAQSADRAMKSALALAVLLIGLIAFTPFACASTYEVWTDGLADADLDGYVLALLSLQVVIDSVVLNESACSDVVVAVISPGDDRGADLVDPSARSARAPPTS